MGELQKIVTSNQELNRIQDQIKSSYDPLLRNFLNGAQMISVDMPGASAPKEISHSLGRLPRGFLVADITANISVWRSSWSANSITLISSAALAGVKILVF
jgi:hypothetical protein